MKKTINDYRNIVSEEFDPFNPEELKAHEKRVYEITEELLLQGNSVFANMLVAEMIDLIDLLSDVENESASHDITITIGKNVALLKEWGFERQANEIIEVFDEEEE